MQLCHLIYGKIPMTTSYILQRVSWHIDSAIFDIIILLTKQI